MPRADCLVQLNLNSTSNFVKSKQFLSLFLQFSLPFHSRSFLFPFQKEILFPHFLTYIIPLSLSLSFFLTPSFFLFSLSLFLPPLFFLSLSLSLYLLVLNTKQSLPVYLHWLPNEYPTGLKITLTFRALKISIGSFCQVPKKSPTP